MFWGCSGPVLALIYRHPEECSSPGKIFPKNDTTIGTQYRTLRCRNYDYELMPDDDDDDDDDDLKPVFLVKR